MNWLFYFAIIVTQLYCDCSRAVQPFKHLGILLHCLPHQSLKLSQENLSLQSLAWKYQELAKVKQTNIKHNTLSSNCLLNTNWKVIKTNIIKCIIN